MYEALGLEMEPFRNLTIFAPLAYGQDPQESNLPTVGHIGQKAQHPAHRARRGHQRSSHSVGPRGRIAARRAHLRSHGLRRQVPRVRRVPHQGARVESMSAFYGESTGLRLLRRQRQLVLERAPPGDHRQGPQPLRRPAQQVPGPPPGERPGGTTRTPRAEDTSPTTRCASLTSPGSRGCRKTSSLPRS